MPTLTFLCAFDFIDIGAGSFFLKLLRDLALWLGHLLGAPARTRVPHLLHSFNAFALHELLMSLEVLRQIGLRIQVKLI